VAASLTAIVANDCERYGVSGTQTDFGPLKSEGVLWHFKVRLNVAS
jgi:hypothetical protein